MSYKEFELPNQRVPESKWTKDYYIEHAQKMVSFLNTNANEQMLVEKKKLIRAYLAELNPEEEKVSKMTTSQYGFSMGIEYEVYPLIETMADQLVGDYLSRPMKKKLYSINKDAINKKLDVKNTFLTESILRDIHKELADEVGFELETENPQLELPNDIEEFFSKSYKTKEEEEGDDIITQFLKVDRNESKIKTLLYDYLLTEECHAFLDEKDGRPTLVRAPFNQVYVDLDPDKEVQDDLNIYAFNQLFTKNEILNKFDLSNNDIKEIDQIFTDMKQGKLYENDIDDQDTNDFLFSNPSTVNYRGWVDSTNKRDRLRALVMIWRSRKEVRYKIITNNVTGEEIWKLLPLNYKERNGDNIKRSSVEVLRKVKMLGPNIVLEYGVDENRFSPIDNKKKVQITAVSLVGKNVYRSKSVRSVASKLYKLQKFASDILFEIKLASKNDMGKVAIYDAAQIPKQFIQDHGKNALSRVMHHMKKDRLMIINSKDKESRHAFNQFTTVDMSNRGQTQDLINTLLLIEDLARKIIGIPKERQGDISPYQTATGVNRAVLASNARTEVDYYPFDLFLSELLNKMLLRSKVSYKEGEVYNLIYGDMQSKFFKISNDYLNTDLGIYIGDSSKEQKSKDIIDRAAEVALGNSQTPDMILNLIDVLDSEFASESKAILERGVKALNKLNEENQKALQQQAQAQAENLAKVEENKTMIERERFKNNIDVASIYANQKTFGDTMKAQSAETIKSAELAVQQLRDEKKEKNEK